MTLAPVRQVLATCVVGLVVLLAALPVGAPGWCTALACAGVLAVATDRRAAHDGVVRLGPADLVTTGRATLACAVAGLAAQSAAQSAAGAEVVVPLVALTAVALVLDLVDGRVARATGTVSALGARLDGEADAFLILVLSLHVARSEGAWVSALGLVRYAYAAAALAAPWLRHRLPPRYWRKVVAAYVGVALAVVASGLLPPGPAAAALVVAAGLLAESFGRDVVWCWHRRPRAVNRAPLGDVLVGEGPPGSR